MARKPGILTRLRQGLLLYVLIMVALGAWLTRARTTDWNDPLWVNVYPIDAAGTVPVSDYLERLEAGDFSAVEEYFVSQGSRYGMTLDVPLKIKLKGELGEQPPTPPESRNPVAIMFWSLKLRYWSWRMERSQDGPRGDIRLYVAYYDPDVTEQLAHSLGLQKGLIGVVNAFGTRRYTAQNNVVIAHELLHTLGATDKYDLQSTLPLHPHGYADPDRSPLQPQNRAEIMGGRIPITSERADMPVSLSQTVVGPMTASEIRWSRP